jgi:hypothetical protein
MNSLVIPVYRNQENLDRLLSELVKLDSAGTRRMGGGLRGGRQSGPLPGESSASACPALPLRTQLLSLSRNFGSFAAIAAGMEKGARRVLWLSWRRTCRSRPSLVLQFFEALANGRAGHRLRRARRPVRTRGSPELAANTFWFIYRRLVNQGHARAAASMSSAARAKCATSYCNCNGVDSNMIALLFWLGYRREYFVYERQARLEGKSAVDIGSGKLRLLPEQHFPFHRPADPTAAGLAAPSRWSSR